MFFDSLIIDIPPLQRGRCHRAGTGQATLEIIGASRATDWNGASQTM